MRKNNVFLIFTILFFFFTANRSVSQNIKKIDLLELQNLVQKDQNKIINFWATWCAPCCRELPHLYAVSRDFPNVKMFFVLLDSEENRDKAKDILKENKIEENIFFLDTDFYSDFDVWLPKVDDQWSGALPFTLFISTSEKGRVEGEMDAEGFRIKIKKFYKQKP